MYWTAVMFIIIVSTVVSTAAPPPRLVSTASRPAVQDPTIIPEEPGSQHVRIRSWDGTVLDGWVVLPPESRSKRVPVVLRSTPYQGTLDSSLNDPDRDATSGHAWAIPVRRLLNENYAVAAFNVRGTGNSGGCFELWGPNEQKDQAFLVEYLARQRWSNGRVAMMGLSYDGTTPLEAAILNPPSLKTIVVAGIVSDLYTTFISPQGALTDDQGPLAGPFYAGPNFAPPRSVGEGAVTRATLHHLGVLPQRMCDDVRRFVDTFAAGATGWAGNDRNEAFHRPRRLMDRFPTVKTAVLLAHGFQDHLAWSEDLAWAGLRKATKLQIEGQWAHVMPPPLSSWNDILKSWLAYWLKGVGQTPAPGMRYQVHYPQPPTDPQQTWRSTTAWPPPEARPEVLYLAADRLQPHPEPGTVTFTAAPTDEAASMTISPRDMRDAYGPPCPARHDPPGPTTSLVFQTAPLPQPTVIAGNPMAYLRISSNRPAGSFTVRLFSLGPDFTCGDGTGSGTYRFLSEGGVDLRFLHGNFVARPFPVSVPTDVRVDFQNLAERVESGHRLAAAMSLGPEKGNLGDAEFASITIHAAGGGATGSHLVVPVTEGTFGGAVATVRYPPRPFAP